MMFSIGNSHFLAEPDIKSADHEKQDHDTDIDDICHKSEFYYFRGANLTFHGQGA